MSYFGKNIRKIRTLKKLSQSELADIFKLTRASIGAYEEGRAEAKVDTLIDIAKYFGISVDSLLCKELTINEISHFNLPFDTLLKPAKESRIENKYLVPLVLTDRFLDYIAKTKIQKTVDEFPTIMLPWIENDTHCAFEHWGSEMHVGAAGLLHKDLVVCKKNTSELKDLEQGKLYTLVTEKNIFTREFVQRSGENFIFDCYNPMFEQEQLVAEQILECWQVIGKISRIIEKPSLIDERVYRLEKQFEKLTKKK